MKISQGLWWQVAWNIGEAAVAASLISRTLPQCQVYRSDGEGRDKQARTFCRCTNQLWLGALGQSHMRKAFQFKCINRAQQTRCHAHIRGQFCTKVIWPEQVRPENQSPSRCLKQMDEEARQTVGKGCGNHQDCTQARSACSSTRDLRA